MTLAQLSCESYEFGTTPELCDAGRYVLGGEFDLDPCSSASWNEHHVRAHRFIDVVEDGLRAQWHAAPGMRISCNPPSHVVAEFFERCRDAWNEGAATWWLGFSLEQLPYLAAAGLLDQEYDRALLRKRVAWLQGVATQAQVSLFDAPKTVTPAPVPAASPTHSNYLALLPAPGYEGQRQRKRFAEAVAQLGGKTW